MTGQKVKSVDVACHGADRTFSFDPARTALLVVDMQRHFLGDADDAEAADEENEKVQAVISGTTLAEASAAADEKNANADVEEDQNDDGEYVDMREIVPRVARLVEVARKMGCTIVHTREGYQPDLSDVSAFRSELGYIGYDSPLGRTLIRGEPGHDFIAELQPKAGELVVDKASFGAFYGTELDDKLRGAGITHLVLCGVTTQCCVHSTLREAVDRGYWCLTMADCCAASEAGLHEAALAVIAGEGHLFGWIADLAELESASIATATSPKVA